MTDKRTHRRTVLYRTEFADGTAGSVAHEQWTVRTHEGTGNVYIDFTWWIADLARHTDVMANGLSQDEAEQTIAIMVASRLREGYEEEGAASGMSSMGRAWNLIDAMRSFIPDGRGGLQLEAKTWLEGHEYYKGQGAK